MTDAAALPIKSYEFHDHHFDLTVWNDFKFRDGDVIVGASAKSGAS
jgi:aryl sulfotransferase